MLVLGTLLQLYVASCQQTFSVSVSVPVPDPCPHPFTDTHASMNKPFKVEFSNLDWSYDFAHFEAWKKGMTGYPFVDAAMRQLAAIGWLNNRCRMVVASFLVKDLLIDWRLGEQHFMLSLIDGDFASNNGGWGFCASSGVDAQPYFRIFNATTQSQKYGSAGDYIRKWVPELAGLEDRDIHEPWAARIRSITAKSGYPEPLVDHKLARAKALAMFRAGLDKG